MAEHERRPHEPTREPEKPAEGGSGLRGMKMPRPRFIVIVLVLLTLNYVSVALLGPGKEPSIDVAYNPTFREQVSAGNVERISAKGETVEGKFKKAVNPPGDAEGGQELRDRGPDLRQHRRALQAARGEQASSSRPSRSTRAGCWSTCCSASAR